MLGKVLGEEEQRGVGEDKGWKHAYAILMFRPKYRTKSLILYVHYFSDSTNVCVHQVFEEPPLGAHHCLAE